jgi:hypothetical protein
MPATTVLDKKKLPDGKRNRKKIKFPDFDFFVTDNDTIVPIGNRIIFNFIPETREFKFYAAFPNKIIEVFPAKYT